MGVMKTVHESVYEQEVENDRIADRSIAERIYGFVKKNELLVLGLTLLAVAFGSLVYSKHKQFVFDEIFTIIVSSQPDLHHFAAAMAAEGNPPLNTFLIRLVIKAFGTSQISVRLVPLFGFLTALIGIYIFVRREAGQVLGILAVLLVIFGPVWQYSYEARPYAILLGAFMVALVGWQAATRITDSNLDLSRVPALLCLALGILGCAFSHYIGLIEIGVPLLVGEAVRTYQRRKIDWPLVATGLCCLPSLLLIVPMMRRTHDVVISKSTILQPPITIGKIHAYYKFAAVSWPLVIDDRIVALLLLIAVVTWAPSASKRSLPHTTSDSVRGVRTYILWACVAASLLIPITWVLLAIGSGWYFCRYGIGSALGVVLCLCLLLAKRRLYSPTLVAAIIVTTSFAFLFNLERELRAGTTSPSLSVSELVETEASDLPIVISNPLLYPSVWWYAPTTKKPHVVYLGAPVHSDVDLASAGLMSEKPYFSAPLLDFESFTHRNSHFLLEYDAGGQLDLRSILKDKGFAIKLVRTKNGQSLFDVDRSPVVGD